MDGFSPHPAADTAPPALFAEIASIAAQACGVPLAFIAIAEGGRHRILASHGDVELEELPGGNADGGLCCQVVHSGNYLEVADAAFDVRFHADELVATRGIRFYAGVPLQAAEKGILGLLCVMDRVPGALNTARRLTLERLGRVAHKLLAARRAERDAAWFGRVLEKSLNEIVVFDATSNRVIHANEGARRNLGYSMDELRGLTGIELSESWNVEARERVQRALLQEGNEVVVFETDVRRKDGSLYPVEARAEFSDVSGRRAFVVTAVDITARRAAEEALHREKELAQITLESIGDAMITTDAQGQVTYLNPVAERLTGWSIREAAGHPVGDIFRLVLEADRSPAESPVDRVLRDGKLTGLANDVVLLARDGRESHIEDSAAPIRDRAGRLVGVVLVCRDVTRARELAHLVSWQASHDALTDLLNRREFERVAARLLESARLHGLEHAVLFIDLDQFKVVNDTCGHLAGDAMLKQLAGVLPSTLRKSDTLARLGGDEFGVLLEGCDIVQATRVAEAILAAIRSLRFRWAGQVFSTSASIGVAAIASVDGDAEHVLSAADTACFLAKDKGRNQVQVYRVEDEEISSRRGELGWAARLAQCVEEQRFFLLCQRVQPLCCASEEPEYLELLLRMRSENGGIILPMAFIPAAERYGLMGSIDRWVIHQTLTCLQRIRLEGAVNVPRFAINLSGTSLSDGGLLDFVLEQFDLTGVPPASICLEVTETAAVANLSRAACLMHRLRELGCRFALDDFGSGLSSFTYLRNLPVDYLKIDGSFVRTIAEDSVNLAMVDAIRRVGEVMGIRTIAESVESQAILDRVRDIGVDFAQGRFIHTPESYYEWRASSQQRRVARVA